jgi:hypothetical protein
MPIEITVGVKKKALPPFSGLDSQVADLRHAVLETPHDVKYDDIANSKVTDMGGVIAYSEWPPWGGQQYIRGEGGEPQPHTPTVLGIKEI